MTDKLIKDFSKFISDNLTNFKKLTMQEFNLLKKIEEKLKDYDYFRSILQSRQPEITREEITNCFPLHMYERSTPEYAINMVIKLFKSKGFKVINK